MDKDVLLVIVGGLIGLVSSLLTIIAQRKLDEKGELNIFYKFSNRKETGESWGFKEGVDEQRLFIVPIVYEFQNTSNVTRVLRDVSLLLYNKNDFVCKMVQVDQINVTNYKGNTVVNENEYVYGSENGSYSFVVGPRSIIQYKCEYMYKVANTEITNLLFDKVMIRYFDERNKEHLFTVRNISDCWEIKTYQADKDWILAE